jgi:hypothetical protein
MRELECAGRKDNECGVMQVEARGFESSLGYVTVCNKFEDAERIFIESDFVKLCLNLWAQYVGVKPTYAV